MKIAHFMRSFSQISETFIYDTVMLLEKNGIENMVVAAKRENEQQRPFTNVVICASSHDKANSRLATHLGKPGNWLAIFSSPRLLRQKVASFIALSSRNRAEQKNRPQDKIVAFAPDILHCHFGWGYEAFHDTIAQFFPDTPLLISLHGSDVLSYPDENIEYKNRLLQIADRPTTRFTANSVYLKGQAVSRGIPADKITILGNTVNENFPTVNRTRHFSSDRNDRFRIIHIGRFVNWKGQRYLVQAFADFCKLYPNSQLTLIGDGESKAEIVALAAQAGISTQVDFLGSQIPHAAIPGILADHDLYIQPSIIDPRTRQAETFGVAILEAIACGLPVVVTGTGGMPEVVSSAGFLDRFYRIVPQQDPGALTAAMRHFLQHPVQGNDNLPYAQERLRVFSNQKYLDTLMGIYADMMARPTQL